MARKPPIRVIRTTISVRKLRARLDEFEAKHSVPSARLVDVFRNESGELIEGGDFSEWSTTYHRWKRAVVARSRGERTGNRGEVREVDLDEIRATLDVFEARYGVESSNLAAAFRDENGKLIETDDFHAWDWAWCSWQGHAND